MSFYRVNHVAGLVGLGLFLSAAPVLAGGFTIIEMGTKKTGMMASVAKPDDLSAVYHNPAGLADLRGTRLHLSSGFSLVDAKIRLKAWPSEGEGAYGSEDFIDTPVDQEGYFQGTVRPTRYFGLMPMFVASSDFGWDQGPVVAISAYLPDFIGAFLPKNAPTRYSVIEAYFIAGVASLTAAYRLPGPLSFLSLGTSVGLMVVRLEGTRWFNLHTLAEYNTDFLIRTVGEDTRLYWSLGLCADILPELTLGLSFIGGTDLELEGRLDIELAPGEEKDPVLKSLESEGFVLEGRYGMTNRMKVPPGIYAGINWSILPELELAVDFRYWFYRVFDQQLLYHDMDLRILGNLAVENPLVTPKQYGDSWAISGGVLGRPFDFPLELMGGWTYDHSPAPSRTKSLDSPTVDLTGFALGIRSRLNQTWRVSLTYYHYWYLKDTVTDSILDPPQNSQYSGEVDTFSLQVEVFM